jgi:hypothetical protein
MGAAECSSSSENSFGNSLKSFAIFIGFQRGVETRKGGGSNVFLTLPRLLRMTKKGHSE